MSEIYGKVVILTGAGISAESGLGTFRDAQGLWAQHRIEDVATPEGFARNPTLVQDFYNTRRHQAAEAQPNAAHLALARLQTNYPGQVVLVTQNVDGLHEAAGAAAVLHMHGSLANALCAACDHRWTAPQVLSQDTPCPHCGTHAARPDVVWFGEMPYHMDQIFSELGSLCCDWHLRAGLPGSGICRCRHKGGRGNPRAEPRTLRNVLPLRSGPLWPCNTGSPSLGRGTPAKRSRAIGPKPRPAEPAPNLGQPQPGTAQGAKEGCSAA